MEVCSVVCRGLYSSYETEKTCSRSCSGRDGLFRSSRKSQSLETGSYRVTASSENARFQWLLCNITAVKAAGFLETLFQDVIRSAGEKRGPTYHIN